MDPDKLESFIPPPEKKDAGRLKEQVEQCIPLLEKAQRPVVILGWGIRLAKAEKEAREFIDKLGFPVLPTWATRDMMLASDPLLIGPFGLHGTRYGNFAVQNADLVLAIGSRLDTHLTGTPVNTFAREAKKIIVDIDAAELNKFKNAGMDVDLSINADAGDFLKAINSRLGGLKKPDISVWQKLISGWKAKYTICPPEYEKEDKINPYVFVKALSQETPEGAVIMVDSGCGVAWTGQGFEFKANQRLFSAFNNTPMGYALPASIGASFALGKKPVVCVTGDGGLQINIQELATIIRHKLPVKIFTLDNEGYSMIRQTQDQWFESRYIASSVESGLAFPDLEKVAKAYGYKVVSIKHNREAAGKIREALQSSGPIFCDVKIDPEHRVIPQVKFGRAIEDSDPLLERKEFFENMIVKPLDGSQAK